MILKCNLQTSLVLWCSHPYMLFLKVMEIKQKTLLLASLRYQVGVNLLLPTGIIWIFVEAKTGMISLMASSLLAVTTFHFFNPWSHLEVTAIWTFWFFPSLDYFTHERNFSNLKEYIDKRKRNIDMFFHLFIPSSVASCMCRDWGSNPQPWCIRTLL